jgi:Domain of unknown function (DUF4406)
MKLYLAGPMRGKPFFNFPEFDKAAKALREAGHEVFSPAERDRSAHGDIASKNVSGDEQEAAEEYGFNLREALAADMKFICEEAEGIALLPGWENSKGALAERATARALGIKEFLIYPQDQYALH